MSIYDRRSFLTSLGASVLAAVACARDKSGSNPGDTAGAKADSSAAQSAGSQADSSQSASRSTAAIPLGVQLYTLRKEMERDVAATLARVAKIGYKEVEFAGYFGKSPKEIRAMLDANGLRAPSAHLQGQLFAKGGWDAPLEEAKAVGHEYAIVPYLPPELRHSLDDWHHLAEQLNQGATKAKELGLRFGYHNHDFEFTKMGGRVPYDVLLAETDPKLVLMEMDLYWATKAGQDPVAYFAKQPGRFQLVHVKDSSGPPENRIMPVGQGTIDFARIFAKRTEGGIQHYFVEHDNPDDPFASIETSYKNLTKMDLFKG
jgi:sugar phosphate isomerase/epimerase